jgi:SsrA-binding protein
MAREEKTVANNKKARHDYFIEETLEAGIVLTGTEVKSMRENGVNLRDTFATIKKDELWLNGVHISPYSHGNRANPDADRARKLLVHKKQIRYLLGKTKETGYTLVPLRIYFDVNNRAKVELALARGKRLFDKRHAIAERDAKRDVERTLGQRIKGM